jgi:hypothetical protein
MTGFLFPSQVQGYFLDLLPGPDPNSEALYYSIEQLDEASLRPGLSNSSEGQAAMAFASEPKQG